MRNIKRKFNSMVKGLKFTYNKKILSKPVAKFCAKIVIDIIKIYVFDFRIQLANRIFNFKNTRKLFSIFMLENKFLKKNLKIKIKNSCQTLGVVRNDMSTTFLQQILNSKLLLVVIIELKK